MNGLILRLIDANANRAREGLRVVEDYARFVLDDESLCGGLKDVRHALADTLDPWHRFLIWHRDTPGDVGTTTKAPGEMDRQSLSHVVIAAGKRVGEALRSIEEYLKTLRPDAAAEIERARYRFYDLERRVSIALRPAGRLQWVRLYVLITESACRGPWLDAAEAAIRGGADCLQLREKDMEGGELLSRARRLVNLCRARDVLCLVNDRADIAVLADADGVHVGQSDLPALEARKLVGPEKIVGVSTHSLGQARRAQLDGADYIGVGPVYRSGTKPRDVLPGLDYARAAAAAVNIPTVAIAGITADNAEAVWQTDVTAVAVTAAVVGAEDVQAAARGMKKMEPQMHTDAHGSNNKGKDGAAADERG